MLSDLGKTIRKRRKEYGLTQAQLAQKAGLSRTTLSKIENGYFGNISVATLDNILSVLGLAIDLKTRNPFAKPFRPEEDDE